MGRKKFNVLMIIFIICIMSFDITYSAEIQKTPSTKELEVSIRILEESSKIELSTKKIKLYENQLQSLPLKMGEALNKYKLSIGMKNVDLDKKTGYIWIEFRLFDNDDKQVTYAVGTVQADKFSLGSGFRAKSDPKNSLVLVIDNL
jgi:hypothetical protein